ncbi:MAG: alanine/glycine:cation symporter family protein [bacterium]
MSFFSVVRDIANFIWGPHMLVFILGSGIYFSLRLKGIQFRQFIPAVRALSTSTRSSGAGNITPYQALMSALSGIVGNGNIAGVATAIVVGGPGTIFWMWISALILMATMYSESLLGFRFRARDKDGVYLGGPMVYIQKGLTWKWLALLFAIAMALKTLLATTSIQSNSMSIVLHNQFDVPQIASCIVIAGLTWLVIIGGLKWIARTAQVLTPFMTIAYILGGLAVITIHYDRIPTVLNEIVKYAFTPHGAVGGAGASAMMALRFGAARGAYSNEAGTGSVAIMHATAQSKSAVNQSLISMLGVFIDTLIICSITALVILSSGIWTGGLNSTALVAESFSSALAFGHWIVLGSSLLFGYSTLIVWCFYGEQCAAFIFGDKSKIFYRWLFCFAILIGATSNAENIWSMGDLLNGLTVLINLVGIVALSSVVVKTTAEHVRTSN